MKSLGLVASILEWAGRISAGALFLLWGAFWIEHLVEWFVQGSKPMPAFVWLAQGLHLLMLLALLLALFKPLPGGAATVVGSLMFFGWIRAFPSVAGLNVVPLVLAAAAVALRRFSPQTRP